MRCNVFAKGDRTDRSIENFMTVLHPNCETFIIKKNGVYWDIEAKYEPVVVEPEEKVEEKKDGDKQVPRARGKQSGTKRSGQKRKVRR